MTVKQKKLPVPKQPPPLSQTLPILEDEHQTQLEVVSKHTATSTPVPSSPATASSVESLPIMAPPVSPPPGFRANIATSAENESLANLARRIQLSGTQWYV